MILFGKRVFNSEIKKGRRLPSFFFSFFMGGAMIRRLIISLEANFPPPLQASTPTSPNWGREGGKKKERPGDLITLLVFFVLECMWEKHVLPTRFALGGLLPLVNLSLFNPDSGNAWRRENY